MLLHVKTASLRSDAHSSDDNKFEKKGLWGSYPNIPPLYSPLTTAAEYVRHGMDYMGTAQFLPWYTIPTIIIL